MNEICFKRVRMTVTMSVHYCADVLLAVAGGGGGGGRQAGTLAHVPHPAVSKTLFFGFLCIVVCLLASAIVCMLSRVSHTVYHHLVYRRALRRKWRFA